MSSHLDFREKEALDRLGNEKELLVMLINTFLGQLANYLDQLDEAAQSRDTSKMVSAAHRLKGACSTVGLNCGFWMARELEMSAKNKNPFPDLIAQQRRLADHLSDKAKPALSDWLAHQRHNF